MKKKLTTVPFNGTEEQLRKLDELIESKCGVKGSLMSVLQGAQEIYGYLPIEVQRHIASKLDVSLSEVYGVASFYSQFTFNPKGTYSVSICLGTACYVKGSGAVLEKLKEVLEIDAGEVTPDRAFSLDVTRCIGACGLAPVMIINNDVYSKITPDEVEGIIAKYRA